MSEVEFYSDPTIPLFYRKWTESSPSERSALKRVRIALTEKCNFACKICYNEGMSEISKALTVQEVELITEAIAPYISEIKLVGGEPLMHPNFGEIAELCSCVCQTTVTTNGCFLERWIQPLSRFIGKITVSVQSLRPDLYRSLMGTRRGPERVLGQISLFTKMTGIPVSVNCVVTKENAPFILDFVDGIIASGVTYVNLLGLLQVTDKDREMYYPLADIISVFTEKYGQPDVVSGSRLRFDARNDSAYIDVVYQFCMVGCDICRTDGFIRFDPTPAISFCLASESISIKEAIDLKDPMKIRQLFLLAADQMGKPTGYKYQVNSRR